MGQSVLELLASCLCLPEYLSIAEVSSTATCLEIHIGCQGLSGACPLCQQLSERVHSRYGRTVADVPCGGRRVLLRLMVRKFICYTPICSQRIPYEKAELRRKQRNRFDQYVSYITERWNQGERNGQRLFQELQAQEYKGGAGTLHRFLRSLRGYSASPQGRAERAQTLPEVPFQQFSAQKAIWLVMRRPADLELLSASLPL